MVALIGILMLISLILFTISVFNIQSKSKITSMNIGLLHPSLLAFLIALYFMTKVSSLLPYTNVSYTMMYVHQGLGFIALLALIVHIIFATIVRFKKISLQSKGKFLNIILWLIYLVTFVITFYIGVRAAM